MLQQDARGGRTRSATRSIRRLLQSRINNAESKPKPRDETPGGSDNGRTEGYRRLVAENSAKLIFFILRHLPEVADFALATAFICGALYLAVNQVFVFVAGYLCAFFAEKGWYGLFPKGLHMKIWPRI
jgi:hypothetical protein